MTELRLRPVGTRPRDDVEGASPGPEATGSPGRTATMTVVGLLAVVILATWLAFSDRGLDRVDESFVLAYVADPEASREAGEISASGFVLHPLFEVAGQSIGMYRLLGAVLVAALAALASLECLLCADRISGRASPVALRAVMAAGAAATSMTAFTFGYRSLSYVSLTLCGLLVVVVGVCRALRGFPRVGGCVVALGWWLTFSGKPTSAAALGLLLVVVLAATRSLTWRLCAAAAGTLLLVVAVTLVSMRMTPGGFLAFLEGGFQQEQMLRSHENVWQLLGFAPNPYLGFVVFGVPLLLVGGLAAEVAIRSPSWLRLLVALGLVVATTLLLVAVGLPGVTQRGFGLQVFPALLMLVGVGAWVCVRSAWVGRRAPRPQAVRDRRLAALTVFLAVLPYVCAVGSNSPFAEAMPKAAVFWLLAAQVGVRHLLGRADTQGLFQRLDLVLTGAAVSVTALVMIAAVNDGGERSLVAATDPVRIHGGPVNLPPREAELATALNAAAVSGGLTPSTAVVDLTGIAPGYAWQLGGTRLGREFYMGIFPGGPEAAAYAVAKASCQARDSAWVLWAADNPWDVSSKVDLDGRRIPEDYEVLTQFSPVQGPQDWRSLRIQVLRPRPGPTSCP